MRFCRRARNYRRHPVTSASISELDQRHRHPDIDAAIHEQVDRVAHSTMLGLTHPGAAELAARLVEIAPPGLSRVFYSESGSTAVEIALKMAFQYWQQRGESARTSFVTLTDAYHG